MIFTELLNKVCEAKEIYAWWSVLQHFATFSNKIYIHERTQRQNDEILHASLKTRNDKKKTFQTTKKKRKENIFVHDREKFPNGFHVSSQSSKVKQNVVFMCQIRKKIERKWAWKCVSVYVFLYFRFVNHVRVRYDCTSYDILFHPNRI